MEQEQEILNDPIAAKIHYLVQEEWTKVDSIYQSIRKDHWNDGDNDNYNDDDTVDEVLEDGLKELKELLNLAHYNLKK